MHHGGWGGLHLVATKFNNFVIVLCMNVILKYDKGHHANPTMAIDFFMNLNMLLVQHQIYLKIFIPWKEGFTRLPPSAR
jgi:hypothetical protein